MPCYLCPEASSRFSRFWKILRKNRLNTKNEVRRPWIDSIGESQECRSPSPGFFPKVSLWANLPFGPKCLYFLNGRTEGSNTFGIRTERLSAGRAKFRPITKYIRVLNAQRRWQWGKRPSWPSRHLYGKQFDSVVWIEGTRNVVGQDRDEACRGSGTLHTSA